MATVTIPPGCTGCVNDGTDFISHDGETCLLHEDPEALLALVRGVVDAANQNGRALSAPMIAAVAACRASLAKIGL